ncbi:MAG: HAMP domain-containing histidine kinase [Clostridiales bacterium]|nr:HAMP domain-containing histidine kinase [Clostridiales bacterium]
MGENRIKERNRSKKSVAKEIFRTNILIILVSLGIFVVIFLFGLNRMDVYSFYSSSFTQEYAEVMYMLSAFDGDQKDAGSALEELAEEFLERGYYLYAETMDGAVLMEGGTAVDTSKEKDKDLWKRLEQETEWLLNDSSNDIFYESSGSMNIISKISGDSGIQLYAVTVGTTASKEELRDSIINLQYVSDGVESRKAVYTRVILLCVSVFGLVLILISLLFSRRLVRHIMVPFDALGEAAGNMKRGDYTHEISYLGDREFEEVCTSFNEMQAQILQEQQKREAYEKARKDMVSGISHDLRTPLTAIRGSVLALRDGIAKTPETERQFLDMAYRRTLEMDRLLDQLLYFSRIETGNMPLHPERVEWNAFLEQYIGKLEREPHEAAEEYIMEGTDEPVFSMVDPGEMERIFDNIVGNSRKYAQAEPLRITFTLRMEQGRIFLTVSDNGEGIPEEKLPFVFDMFYRADESRNKVEGSGLGLHIVQYLAKAMGGSVRATSDGGFTVHLEFPVMQEEK